MTSSSSASLQRGLDTMLLVYSSLQGHPANVPCQQFLRADSGWFTAPVVLVEAKNILTKVYRVSASEATNKVLQFVAGPVVLLPLDQAVVIAAMNLADTHRLDLTDAILLHLACQHGVSSLATEDQRLSQVCTQCGVTPETPLDAALRQQVAVWEAANLPAKGLARMVRSVHGWLSLTHPQAALDFWSKTAGGTRLP